MVIAAQERGLDAQRLSHALLRALWAEERDTSRPEGAHRDRREKRLCPARRAAPPRTECEVQALYKATATKPRSSAYFGAPTYVLHGERFWGQDRLEFLDRALALFGLDRNVPRMVSAAR
jgi:2-hydroxychromene-2-carboxylate isomerase